MMETAEMMNRIPTKKRTGFNQIRLWLSLLVLCWPMSGYGQTEQENQAYAHYQEQQYLTALRLANEVLQTKPDSMIGHYVKGGVYLNEMAILSKAIFHLKQADEIFTSGRHGYEERPWNIHLKVLRAYQEAAREQEDFELQFKLLERYNELYEPEIYIEKAWPLMKLGKVSESYQLTQRGLASNSSYEQRAAWNLLCSLDSYQGLREKAFQTCEHAVEVLRKDDNMSAILLYNTGLAAIQKLDFPKALDWFRQSIENKYVSFFGYLGRLQLYTSAGRLFEAARDLRQMFFHFQSFKGIDREQNRARANSVLAQFLLALGDSENGLHRIREALDFPDRLSGGSYLNEEIRGSYLLIKLALWNLAQEQEQERQSTLAWTQRTWFQVKQTIPDPVIWLDRMALRNMSGHGHLLLNTLRIHLDVGMAFALVWSVGDLMDHLGTGVLLTTLYQIRRLETYAPMKAYYDGLEAEIRWKQGNSPKAFELAEASFSQLPEAEHLFRARIAAIGAATAPTFSRSLSWYQKAMTLDPGIMRRLKLRLPARLHNKSDHPLAKTLAKMLEPSPRFEWSEGFLVTILEENQSFSLCLSGPQSELLTCAQAHPPKDQVPLEDQARELVL
ncbi:MAG: tetratricopeptide repeat protein, partial [SAR324 cluster bacterium]|nr:tetratricopeptide repeat protein [SAR324 cluster bacterium]